MATGDLGSVIDTLEFDTTYSGYNFIFEVASGILGVMYRGVDSDGWLATFAVDSEGNIGAAPIDTLEIDLADLTTYGEVLKIVGTTKFILVWTSTSNHGYIGTVDIDAAGNIGAALIDSYEFDAGTGKAPSICLVATTKYAISYTGTDSDGYVATIDVAADGTITEAFTDSWEWHPETTLTVTNRILKVSGTIYVISAKTSDGVEMSTITIADDGTITESILDSLVVYAAGTSCYLANYVGNVYVMYYVTSSQPWIATMTVDGDGSISAVLDTQRLDLVISMGVGSLIVSKNNTFVIVAATSTAENLTKAYSCLIDGSGNIAGVKDTLIIDASYGRYRPQSVRVDDGIYVVTYTGEGDDGYASSFGATEEGNTIVYSTPIVNVLIARGVL
jgi:hypothetical protein